MKIQSSSTSFLDSKIEWSTDRRTVTALEIIGNVRDGNQEDSLLGAINRTKTKIGERLLRSNLCVLFLSCLHWTQDLIQ